MKLREIAIVRVPLCFYSPLSHYTFHSEAFEDRHGDADGDIFFRDFIRTGERAVFEKSAKGCTLTSRAPTALCGLQGEENKASSGLVLVGVF